MCQRGAYWTQSADEQAKLNKRRKSENYKTGGSKYMRQKIEINVSLSILPCLSYASIISVSFKILLNLSSSRICMKYLDVKQC
jgi:hypothetical protein